ncbi:MAG: Txe/YoeB family addiction module toxin [Akkermansia sp.]
MKLELSRQAREDLAHWARSDRKTALKIADLLEEIRQTPYTGKGKPEPLRHELSGYWSRRINTKDRIVYRIDETNATAYIASLRNHYS